MTGNDNLARAYPGRPAAPDRAAGQQPVTRLQHRLHRLLSYRNPP